MSTSSHITSAEDRIPWLQKAVYSIGALVNNMQAAAVGSLVIVLNLGLGMNPALVGFIGAVPLLIDAIIDPMVGYASDNTRTRYGRRRPFIFFGALAAGILFALMFQLYPGQSENFYFWYFLTVQCFLVLAFACYSIPWIALGYELTPDYHERTRLQGVSNFVAQFAWLMSPWFYKIMNNKELFPDIVSGARTLALFIGVFIAVGGVLPAIFTKEHFANLPQQKPGSGGADLRHIIKDFINGFTITLQSRPFVKLCAVTFLVFNGFMLASSFSAYVIFFYVYGGDFDQGGTLLGWFGTVSSICTFGAISITTWLSTRLGKRNTFILTISISIIGYGLKWLGYNPQHPYLLLIAAPFIAFGLGSLFTLVSSMIVDICDLDELQTGTRREGMFSAIYWWMVKLGMAGASLLSGILLNATGFNVKLGAAQSASALFFMRLCDVGIPMASSLAAIFIIMTFDISEQQAYDIRRQLETKRGKA